MTDSNRLSGNQILDALRDEEYDLLLPYLEEVGLPYGKVIYNIDDSVSYVYFPNSGMASLLSITEEGATIEVGMVGNEGMLGIPVILGVNKIPYQVMVQAQGTALRLRTELLKKGFDRRGALHDLLLRYTYALITQLSQSAVCNRFHTVEARLCRWLLTTGDRVKSDRFKLTQEFLSHMLGSRRQGVTEAAGAIQKAGLIRYVRGQITLIDREGLESTSCECYKVVKVAYSRGAAA